MYTLGKTFQDRKDAGLTTNCLFLDVQRTLRRIIEKGVVEKVVGNWEQTKYVENDEEMTECTINRSAVMLDGELSNYVVIHHGVAQECTLSPN